MFHKTQDEIMKTWDTSIEKPMCSILSWTYNHASYIEQALNSFLEQETTFPFEIIVHDDCSTDGTDLIIKEYEKKYPKIIKALYEEENQYQKGLYGRDFGAEMFRMASKYIALCEGDDYWNDPKKLQKQIDFLESDSEKKYVLCYHECKAVNTNGEELDEAVQSVYFDTTTRDFEGWEMQEAQASLPTRTICFRNVIDFNDPSLLYCSRRVFNYDTFLWILSGKHGNAKYLSDIKPAYYRIHEGGVWTSLNEREKSLTSSITWLHISNYFAEQKQYELSHFYTTLSVCRFVDSLCQNAMQWKDMNSIVRRLVDKIDNQGGYKNWLIRLKIILKILFPDLRLQIIALRKKFRKQK